MRLAIVGNSCSGKTTLTRILAQRYGISPTHVDSIQFLPGMKIRPHKESISLLQEIQKQPSWIIDGYGPLDIIENRFKEADVVIFIDFPIWRNFLWCLKRQAQNLWSVRQELPEDSRELSLSHTKKLFQNIWKAHKLMRPELLRIFARDHLKSKMVFVRSMSEWHQIARNGISAR